MKILEMGKFYPPHRGGIETLLRALCEGFVQRGDEVECVVANDAPRTVREKLGGVRIHRHASYGSLFATSVCPTYLNAPRRFNADIWNIHFPNPLADLTTLLGRRRTPLVVSYHSDIVKQAKMMLVYRFILRALLKRADRILVATPKHLEYSPHLQPYKDKVSVIPFGINFEKLEPCQPTSERVASLKSRWNGKPIILNIGRLVGYKGQKHMIQAAKHLDAHFWFVGTGPLETELKQQAAELGVSDRVTFWGSVGEDQLPAMLHACDIFCFPSVTPNEAFGLVQVEAMICRKPVISCDLKSGVPYVNQDGVSGLVVKPEDDAGLTSALKKLIQDEGLRRQFGEAGRKRAEMEFEESVMVERYRKCFLEVIEQKSNR